MIRVANTEAVLGATIHGVDLSKPMADSDFAVILRTLGHRGVLRFPEQALTPGDVSRFSALFGEIQGNPIGKTDAKREHPEVLIFGLVLSIALMGLAASFIARLLNRHRWIAYVGLAIIVFVAGQMIWTGLHELAPVVMG